MPTATIDRDQRDGIYEVVRNHLSGLNDVWLALEMQGDHATARRIALAFVEDVRLLEEIGWAREEERELFELAMPPAELAPLLARLGEEAEIVLGQAAIERRAPEAEEEIDRRMQIGAAACAALLAELGGLGGGR